MQQNIVLLQLKVPLLLFINSKTFFFHAATLWSENALSENHNTFFFF